MMMTPDDLSRRFFLDVTADGAVFIRERGQRCTDGALPVFTTDTYEAAEMLQMRHCRRANDGTGIYRLNHPPRGLADIYDWCVVFRRSYEKKRIKKVG